MKFRYITVNYNGQKIFQKELTVGINRKQKRVIERTKERMFDRWEISYTNNNKSVFTNKIMPS